MPNAQPPMPNPPAWSTLELDENELEDALDLARKEKYFRLKREAWQQEISRAEAYKRFTAEQLLQLITEAGYEFKTEAHQVSVKNLCCYFTGDPRFRGHLGKGILLLGQLGSGKTSIMRVFGANQHQSYRLVNMIDIVADYKMHGEQGVKPYNANYTAPPNAYGKREYGYCFDDLGTEEIPARHFGETKNVFAEILQLRYNNRHLVPFNSTHATSNKTEDELEELYGSRAYDRMKEMFNVIIFNHESFR